jgi:hypothetical protein
LPPAERRGQAFTLWLRSAEFRRHAKRAVRLIHQILADNPFTTLQVVVEAKSDLDALTPEVLGELMAACQSQPTYLDRYYALQPGRAIGAKRLIVLADWEARQRFGPEWSEGIGEFATIIWRGSDAAPAELDEYEHLFM